MIQWGLEHGIPVDGEAIVLLEIKRTESKIMHWHLAEQSNKISGYKDNPDIGTATGRGLDFIMALPDEIQRARKRYTQYESELGRWR